MASLNFCEDLGVGVVVVEVELTVARDKGAALRPAGEFGDEEVGTGEFDIDIEGFFKSLDGFKESGRFREGFEVDVYGGLAPTVKNRRGSPDEINTPKAAHLLAQRGAK